ncbi:hypothetical protein ACIBF5_16645 [Micromonospora sp. NPDC050417]|uniref:hypothetical protein n=1 Tax=Micromonospora sp. NPDC050417 TaxID=3364280 RepID=UPI00378F2D2F
MPLPLPRPSVLLDLTRTAVGQAAGTATTRAALPSRAFDLLDATEPWYAGSPSCSTAWKPRSNAWSPHWTERTRRSTRLRRRSKLNVTRDLKLAIAGIPGLQMLRRRGEGRVVEE